MFYVSRVRRVCMNEKTGLAEQLPREAFYRLVEFLLPEVKESSPSGQGLCSGVEGKLQCVYLTGLEHPTVLIRDGYGIRGVALHEASGGQLARLAKLPSSLAREYYDSYFNPDAAEALNGCR